MSQMDFSYEARLVARLGRNNDGFVYVIGGGGLYKIGASQNVEHRLIDLQVGSPVPLKVVCVIKTTQYTHISLERALHRRLVDKRRHGEWFDLDESDLARLRALAKECEIWPAGIDRERT